MNMTTLDFPGVRPTSHGEEAIYYEYCQRGELRIQFCPACEEYIFYPRAICPSCLTAKPEWILAEGRGTVHTFTVQFRAAEPFMKGPLPFVVAIIELAEGVRMLSRVVAEPSTVYIEMPVKVAFAKIDSGFQVPVFVPEDATE